MLTSDLERPSSAADPSEPNLIYIIPPLVLWGVRWMLLPLLAPDWVMEEIVRGAGRLVGYSLVPFLLAYYASGGRRTHDWHAFSQWFGVAALLYPLLWPISNTLAVFMAFKIAKNRHPRVPWRAQQQSAAQS
jgi:hypothetical protein